MRKLLLASTFAIAAAAAVPVQAVSIFNLKNDLIQFLLEKISDPGVFEVSADTVEDREEGGTRLVGLTVSDAAGEWLTIDSAEFKWSPSRLLKGQIEIDLLKLTGPHLTRLPDPGPGTPDPDPEPDESGPLAWPRSPIALLVRKFEIEGGKVDAGPLPQSVAFDATGRVRDEADEQSLRFNLRRTDQVSGAIDIAYVRDFAVDALRLEIKGSEQAGGLVGALAGLPEQSPVTIDLAAEGPATDWRMSLALAAESVISLSGNADVVWAGPIRAKAAFDLTPGPLLDPAARRALGDTATLRVDAQEGGAGRITINEADLRAADLLLEVSGALERTTMTLDLDLAARAATGLSAFVDGVVFDAISFDGQIAGPPDDLTANGALVVDQLAADPVELAQLRADARFVKKADAFELALDGVAEGTRFRDVGPDVIGPVQLVLDAGFAQGIATLREGRLDSRIARVDAKGTIPVETDPVDLTVTMRVDEPASALLDGIGFSSISFDGRAEGPLESVVATGDLTVVGLASEAVSADDVTAQARLERVGDGASFEVDAKGNEVRLDAIDPKTLGPLTLSVKGAADQTTLTLEQARLDAAIGEVETKGTIPLGDGEFNLNYAARNIALGSIAKAYGADATGTADAAGAVTGPTSALQIEGRVASADTSANAARLGTVSLAHDVTLGDAIEGMLTVALQGSDVGDGTAETTFTLLEETLRAEPLKGDLAGLKFDGSAVVDLPTALAAGAVDLSAPSLAPIGRLAGLNLRGAARGKVSFDHTSGTQSAAASLTVSQLALDDISLSQATLEARASDLLGSAAVNATLRLAELEAGGAELASVGATAKGPLASLSLTVDTNGTVVEKPLDAALVARMKLEPGATIVDLTSLDVTYDGEPFRLVDPTRIAVKDGRTRVSGLNLSLPDQGAVRGDLSYASAGTRGEISLVGVPLRLAKAFADAPMRAGELDGSIRFDTSKARAGADGTIVVDGLRLDGVAEDGEPIRAEARFDWNGALASTVASISGGFGEPVRLEARLPLVSRAGLPAVPADADIDAILKWAGAVEPLWAMVPAPDHLLQGSANIDLRVSGPLANPNVAGDVSLRDGLYQNLTAGTILTDLVLETAIASTSELKLDLRARDGSDGQVSGTVELGAGDSGPTLDVRINSTRAVLVRRDDAVARIDADVSVTGPVVDLAVTGDIEIVEAEIRLINQTPPTVVDLGPIEIKGAPPSAEPESDPGRVALDLNVTAPGRIFIRGRGLDSEWMTDLDIQGTAARPLIRGEISSVRGYLDFAGRPFELERGKVVFLGSRSVNPELDISLAREANGITGRILLEGTASKPELRFASTPAVPDDEVLPRVIFGRSLQSLSGAEAVQLASGIATLMSGEAGVTDIARAALGVDVLRFDSTEEEGASVSVGKYVADGVYVGARQAVGGTGGAAIVELEVIDNVVIDAELGQSSGSSVGANWKIDF